MADEIKKTIDEVKENTAGMQEGILSDEESEKAAGGWKEGLTRLRDIKPVNQFTGNTKDR